MSVNLPRAPTQAWRARAAPRQSGSAVATTACARSTRRTTVRGWNVWFGKASMMPARATGAIQRSAHCPRISVITPTSRTGAACSSVRQADADERRQLGARHLRAVLDGAVLLGQRREFGASRAAPSAWPRPPVSGSSASASV